MKRIRILLVTCFCIGVEDGIGGWRVRTVMDGSVLVVADDIGPTANLVHAVNFSKAFVGRYQVRLKRIK